MRASYLTGQVLERRMRSFVMAAVDETATDTEWLEALAMIVVDKPAESKYPESLIYRTAKTRATLQEG